MSVSGQLWPWIVWAKQHGPLLMWSTCGLAVASQLPRLCTGWRRVEPEAHWASRRDLQRAYLLGKHGIVLGRIGRTVLRYHGRGHAFVVAATQTGKSASIVKTTLLEEQPRTSILVFDPKGELYETTSAYRKTVSRVVRLAPCAEASECYNPLDAVRLDAAEEVADVGLLAQMLANPEGRDFKSESEEHFVKLSEIAMRGLLLYGLETGQALSLGDLYTLITQGQLPDVITAMVASAHPVLREAGTLLQGMDEKQYSNVLTTLMRTVELYGDPTIANMLMRSDFTVDELRRSPQPLTVYISVPFAHLERTRGLTRLLFRQLLSRATDVPNDWRQQGYWKLLVMGEEFPSLRRLQIAADILNHGAGLGVQLCTISPSLNDIEDIWGMHHNFLDNSHVHVYFGITDERVAERVSRRLGTHTVTEDRVSWQRGGRSVSRVQVKRPLLDSSAITHMDPNDVLILARQHQVIAQQTPWDQCAPWASRGRHPHA